MANFEWRTKEKTGEDFERAREEEEYKVFWSIEQEPEQGFFFYLFIYFILFI